MKQWSLLLAFVLFGIASAHAEKPPPFIFTPTNGPGPFPVMVWLHGYRGYSTNGYKADESSAAFQKHANTLGAVILGFPATSDLGDGTQQWAEEPDQDHAYIQSRLKELAKTQKLDLNKVALFGFSQGAMVAADIATRYPENYLGAIIMSPGGMEEPKTAKVRKPEHAQQVYYCLCGADEHPGNVQLTKAYAKHLESVLGAKVTLKLYPGVSKHTRPPDFMEKFPEWVAAILKQDVKPGK